jgi:cell division protein FtsB
VKRILKYLKNKFIVATVLFFVYTLFLDENDIFTIISQSNQLSKLEQKKAEAQADLEKVTLTLNKLKHHSEIERFAREEKFFKKNDEDIFVLFYE